jgi:arginine decarboxylase
MGRSLVANRFFLTTGVGVHKDELMSFELALEAAGVENFNMVKISSVLPAGCRLIEREEGIVQLVPGQITFAVLARSSTPEPGRRVAAALGLAIPEDVEQPGYISEVEESFGLSDRAVIAKAEKLALEIMASRHKARFVIEDEFDPRKKHYRVGKLDVRIRGIAQVAVGDEDGRHTTVIAAAVFLFDSPVSND